MQNQSINYVYPSLPDLILGDRISVQFRNSYCQLLHREFGNFTLPRVHKEKYIFNFYSVKKVSLADFLTRQKNPRNFGFFMIYKVNRICVFFMVVDLSAS